MRSMLRACFVCVVVVLLASPSATAGPPAVDGDWLLTTDFHGQPLHQRLTLAAAAGKLTGDLGGITLDGTITGSTVHFTIKDGDLVSDFTGTISGATITGKLVDTIPTATLRTTFTASRRPVQTGKSQRREFVPTKFERAFSADVKPVLELWPGDSLHTTTVDASGVDAKGVHRVLGGNPETGPFYVQTALPGDVLVVHFTRIRLNRDSAVSDDALVPRALGPRLATEMKDVHDVHWQLDREHLRATPTKPSDRMRSYSVALRPMLGCVAVAPGFGSAPVAAGDSGRFGGNLDFSGIVEGATVYLPVTQPGALLYIGDGHAMQGDGELNGNALETSMDVELTVDVIRNHKIGGPRVDADGVLSVIGLGGSLDDAFREAIDGMAQWLEQDYKLAPSDLAQVLGTAVELRIGEVADRNASVIARVRKDQLAGLSRP
jgi:amidase